MALRALHLGHRPNHERVVRTQRLLANRQRAIVERLGLSVLSLHVVDGGQILTARWLTVDARRPSPPPLPPTSTPTPRLPCYAAPRSRVLPDRSAPGSDPDSRDRMSLPKSRTPLVLRFSPKCILHYRSAWRCRSARWPRPAVRWAAPPLPSRKGSPPLLIESALPKLARTSI
jgi:hypothetical protein